MAQKKITDLTLRTNFDGTCNAPVDDTSQTWRVTGAQMLEYFKSLIAPLTAKGDVLSLDGSLNPLVIPAGTEGQGLRMVAGLPTWSRQNIPSAFQKFLTAGSATYNPCYAFFIASGSATLGATYTDSNSTVFTVFSTIASGTLLYATGATAPASAGTLTKTSGTGDTTISYSFVRAPIQSRLKAKGGGGGGAGSSQGAGGSTGTAGGNTTFGSLITAGGGAPGAAVASSSSGGGAGGTGSTTLPGRASGGQGGQGGFTSATGSNNNAGGVGGGHGGGNSNTQTLGAAGTSGGGGAGGGFSGSGSSGTSGGGGGEGAEVEAIYQSPATQSLTIGAGGTHGGAGTSGSQGGTGGDGWATAEDCYQ